MQYIFLCVIYCEPKMYQNLVIDHILRLIGSGVYYKNNVA